MLMVPQALGVDEEAAAPQASIVKHIQSVVLIQAQLQ